MTIAFKPIKPKKISDQVFEQIRELIFRGQLKPSQQLLPERELAEQLNVSRTTVRNAINKLEVMGLLEHKQGQGTFVRSPETWRQDNPLAMAMRTEKATLKDLLEVRLGMECNAAALAAERAERRDLEFMQNSMKEFDTEIQSGHLGTDADTAFHMAIAFATKNPFHVYIMKNFYDLLFSGIRENLSHLYRVEGNLEKIFRQHMAIFESIRNSDSKAAYNAMKQHINFVIDFLKNQQGD